MLAKALNVLAELPAPGDPLPVLADRVLKDTHALYRTTPGCQRRQSRSAGLDLRHAAAGQRPRAAGAVEREGSPTTSCPMSCSRPGSPRPRRYRQPDPARLRRPWSRRCLDAQPASGQPARSGHPGAGLDIREPVDASGGAGQVRPPLPAIGDGLVVSAAIARRSKPRTGGALLRYRRRISATGEESAHRRRSVADGDPSADDQPGLPGRRRRQGPAQVTRYRPGTPTSWPSYCRSHCSRSTYWRKIRRALALLQAVNSGQCRPSVAPAPYP